MTRVVHQADGRTIACHFEDVQGTEVLLHTPEMAHFQSHQAANEDFAHNLVRYQYRRHPGIPGSHGLYRVECPPLDVIQLPEPESFESAAAYYATSLHEHAHWTGHKTRLARDLSGRFKDASYAAEELVAELAAAFLCARLSIPGQLRHAGYIESWAKILREDKRAIFTATSKATEAAQYLERAGGLIPGEDGLQKEAS